jgi:hypothetical protein
MGKRVLIAGESWMTTSTHVKGVDEFSVHSYVEGVGPLRDALTSRGHDVTHMPAHLVPTQFPGTAEASSFSPTSERTRCSWLPVSSTSSAPARIALSRFVTG